MALYAIAASAQLREASRTSTMSGLPTPFQISLLVGVLLGSIDQLREYLVYLCRRKRTAYISPVVHRSAIAFLLTVLLASAVVLADTILHYVTSTVSIELALSSTTARAFSRALSQTCLTFDRTGLYGWPCSVAIGWDDPNFFEEQNEAIRLSHNSSMTSQIQTSLLQNATGNLAYLLPEASQISNATDYSASTLGISSQCTLLPPSSCGVSKDSIWGPQGIYTNFSCSPSFHGTLGITPAPSEADGSRSPDPYRSFLMYKPTANLMYSFFNASDLQTVYNTPGYNDSGQLDPDTLPLPDSNLVNPFYVALAVRLPLASFAPGSSMMSSDLTFIHPENAYADFLLSCAVRSYDVEYSFVRGAVKAENMIAKPHTDGKVLEIFHGSLLYNSVGNQGYDIQDFLAQSALAPTSDDASTTDIESFTSSFATLYSTKVLAKIGAYTVPENAIKTQDRKVVLVAKVPKAALIVLVALSFMYPVVGLALACRAISVTGGWGWKRKQDQADPRSWIGPSVTGSGHERQLEDGEGVLDIASQLSLAGLAAAAFGEKLGLSESDGGSLRRLSRVGSGESGFSFGSSRSGKSKTKAQISEARRVVVSGDGVRGWGFKVWV
jgi:hypothetical protein